MTSAKNSSDIIVTGLTLLLLTFLIPAALWLVQTWFPSFPAATLLASLVLAAVCCLWNVSSKSFAIRPDSRLWKQVVLLLAIAVLVFVLLDLQQRPVSVISGQARSSWEILDVILAAPLLEELLFRGVIWHLVEQRYRHHAHLNLPLLAVTSVLFGLMHAGYWLPSGLPLPARAYSHMLGMVFAGLCFGLLRLRSRSLAAPAGVHMLANAVILFFQ